MDYSETWNLKSIPRDVFYKELSRRSYEERVAQGTIGGRPIVLRVCRKCGQKFSTVALRKHQPRCRE